MHPGEHLPADGAAGPWAVEVLRADGELMARRRFWVTVGDDAAVGVGAADDHEARVGALAADPRQTSEIQQSISTWPYSSPAYFAEVQKKVQGIVFDAARQLVTADTLQLLGDLADAAGHGEDDVAAPAGKFLGNDLAKDLVGEVAGKHAFTPAGAAGFPIGPQIGRASCRERV